MSAAAKRSPMVSPAQQRVWRRRLRTVIREAGFAEPAPAERAASASARPFWELEPIPLVIGADEWSQLEAGLRQRARFVNALLVDVYDRQEVLHQGLIPPDVVLGDPYYRRPCLRLDRDSNTPATLLRFDLVKAPPGAGSPAASGGWHVAQTRVNTPVGLSYAVQNRRFMTQEAGELYSRLPDHHSIINFPLQLLDSLRQLTPRGSAGLRRPDEAPAIVMLTAGPQDPFYTEHSFLARKMGLPLAKGDDLLVLDNRVYFKTIAGIERVDVIYRRLNDAHIDPVVFDTDRETAGVPGLLQCIRTGNVVVSNAIGAGVAESRALDAWLPRLMRFYLGEKPLLPPLPTFTCGDNDQLDYILENRARLRVRAAHDPRLGDPRLNQVPPALVSAEGLAPEVRQNPFAYVAQQWIPSVPVDPSTRRSPPFCLSAYVLAQGDGFVVLPGGLVRLGGEPPPLDRVGTTTDAIVLRSHDEAPGEIATEVFGDDEPGPLAPHHALGSRTAESLFWLGRYAERAEATARMLSIIDDVALEEIPARERRRWLPLWQGLLEATGHGSKRISAREAPAAALAGDLNWRMTLDARHQSSLYSSIESAIFNAQKLRDYVSPEAWRVLHQLQGKLEALRRQGELRKPSLAKPQTASATEAVMSGVNSFISTAGRTMLHDAGWRFLSIGMHLERATMVCSALRHVLGGKSHGARVSGGDNPELSALLRMLGSQDAYRKLYQARSQPLPVADFFLRRSEAPRSVLHNLERIESAIRAIGVSPDASAPVEAAVASLLASLHVLDLAQMFKSDTPAGGPLGDFLTTLLNGLGNFHPLLSDHYFSHQARVTGTTAQGDLVLQA